MEERANSQNIAIVGSGIAGLTAAYYLSQKHQVTVYEANDYIGGHTHTVPVSMDNRTLQVDTGFIVCNDRNYPHFLKLLDELDVSLQDTEMSFSVTNASTGLEYNGHNLNTLFAQRRNLLNPRFYGLLREILRFNRIAKLSQSGQDAELTLQEFLNKHHFSNDLCRDYLLPMVAAIWSCSVKQAGEFPLGLFLRFFLNHGLLDIKNRPQWHVLVGGSKAYIEPLTRPYSERIQLSKPVREIRRLEDSVEIVTDTGKTSFDHVVLACHSDQALSLLQDPSPEEQSILGDLTYQANDVTLHSDRNLMPRSSRAWASWNFLAGGESMEQLPIVTYSMNILQRLESSRPLLVSLNAREKIRDDQVIEEFNYSHPVYSAASVKVQTRRNEICGNNRSHFCGAYWYNGFHEDGVRSALDVCARFGIQQ